MTDDTKSNSPDANSDGKGSVSEAFNRENELAEQIAKASPEAKAMVKNLQDLAKERTEREIDDQRRARKFRTNACKVELLERYIKDQALRPESVKKAPEQDLQLIAEQAEATVKRREAFYVDRIQQETDANIRQVLRNDQHQHKGPDFSRDFEHERDR